MALPFTGRPRGMCWARRRGEYICSEPTTNRIEIGCVHEHVGYAYACKTHTPMVSAGKAKCGSCLELGCRCLLSARTVAPYRSE